MTAPEGGGPLTAGAKRWPAVRPPVPVDGNAARRPTMSDVARLAGVSTKTVSRVINGDPQVGAEYVTLVNEAIATTGYRPNTIARTLRVAGRTATIGLIIEDLANPFYSAITRAAERVARGHGTLLVTVSSEEDPVREREVIEELCARRVDGLIVVPTFVDHSFCRDEIESGTPMVFVDRAPHGVEADVVLIDNEAAASEATWELIRQGHKRIGIIGQDRRLGSMEERLAGFRRAFEEAGIEQDDALMRFGPVTADEGAAAARSLLGAPDPPTALFCCTNQIALGVLEELQQRGRQLDVMCFDDTPYANLFSVTMTLVAYDVASIGQRAAELLFDRIRGSKAPPRTVRIPTWLVKRGAAPVLATNAS